MTTKWLYDVARHPASASWTVRHRGCAESFAHTLAWVSSLITCVFSLVAWFFAVGATDYSLALGVVTGVLWLVVFFVGEWAMYQNKPMMSYAYAVSLYGLWAATIWCAAMCKTDILSGIEYYEENWYLVQTQVLLPFTTLLDQKLQFAVRGGPLPGRAVAASFLVRTRLTPSSQPPPHPPPHSPPPPILPSHRRL